MSKKEKFLCAIEILAPGDIRIYRIAERVSEQTLSSFPGGAALDLVSSLQTISRQECPARPRERHPVLPRSGAARERAAAPGRRRSSFTPVKPSRLCGLGEPGVPGGRRL